MAKNLLYDGVMGKVYHDDAKDVIIKECTPGTLDLKSLRHYMEFQKTTPHVVKVLDLIDEKHKKKTNRFMYNGWLGN